MVPGENGATERWRYHTIKRDIHLRNGDTAIVKNYVHPDPFAEAVRWQVCEAQLLQSLGRGRWVRRDDGTQLNIVIRTNEALIMVDEVISWEAPSRLAETAVEGVMLNSPTDIAALWGEIWNDEKAVRRDLKKVVPELPSFAPVTYQRKGPKLKRQRAWFDTRVIVDPALWEGWKRLGGLAFFTFE